MPLSYHEFVNEIEEYKKLHGLQTTDDDYRRKFWLPYLPVDRREEYLKERRVNWYPNTEKKKPRDYFRLDKVEKPTRIVENGFVLGVPNIVPRYTNRDPNVAKEFQGARIKPDLEIRPDYPSHIPSNVANYLMHNNSLLHRDCTDVEKNAATLWRDLINSDLDYKIISGIPQWYHPLLSSAKARFDQRWPEERKQKYPDDYLYEFCKLFHTPSQIFVPDWIDEQLTFPFEHYPFTKE